MLVEHNYLFIYVFMYVLVRSLILKKVSFQSQTFEAHSNGLNIKVIYLIENVSYIYNHGY